MSLCKRCLLPVALGVFTACSAGAEDLNWTGWLGPERNGSVAGFEVPQAWSKEIQKSWTVQAGTGYGTPIVVDDRVFQHGRLAGKEVVSCFNLRDGKRLWQEGEEVAFKMGGGADFHGKGPKSSPVYADGRLFTLSITGVLTARDGKTGKQLWRRDYREEFQQNHPYWGVSTSPIVDGKQLVVHLGNDDSGALIGFDTATGKEIWRHGKEGTSYSSPLVVEIDGVRQIVQWTHEDVIGVESQTGKLLWSFHFPHRGNNQNMPTPVYHRGHLLVGGENRGIKNIQIVKTNENAWKAVEVWHQEEVALDMSTAVINDEHLYGMSHYKLGRLFCLDPESGKVHWQTRGREGDNVAFLTIPGHVLALNDKGTLKVLRADPAKYEEIISYEVADSPTWAPPVLLADGFLIKGHDTLTRWVFKP